MLTTGCRYFPQAATGLLLHRAARSSKSTAPPEEFEPRAGGDPSPGRAKCIPGKPSFPGRNAVPAPAEDHMWSLAITHCIFIVFPSRQMPEDLLNWTLGRGMLATPNNAAENITKQNATCHSLLLWQGTHSAAVGCHRLPGERLGMTATCPAHRPYKTCVRNPAHSHSKRWLPAARAGLEDKDRPGGQGQARRIRRG